MTLARTLVQIRGGPGEIMASLGGSHSRTILEILSVYDLFGKICATPHLCCSVP
jgi:hypothetical protein